MSHLCSRLTSISHLQVTTLVNTSNKGPSSKKKGRSKKAHVLAVSVEQATQNFLEKGEQIAKDSQDLKEELIAAVEDVRKQGERVFWTPSTILHRAIKQPIINRMTVKVTHVAFDSIYWAADKWAEVWRELD